MKVERRMKEVKRMELIIKAKVNQPAEFKKVVEVVRKIEKEHSCNCTLLEIEQI